MPLTVVNVPTLTGYVPPKGKRIKLARRLKDGTYDVTLEPIKL